MQDVPVWDVATRIFHWLLATAVLVCIFTGEDEGLIFAVHAYAGFLVLILIVFRLGWGLVGSPRSRFADFVYSWTHTAAYLRALLRFRPPKFVGHNPLGGWMVVLMLAVLLATAGTGLLIAGGGSRLAEEVHESLGSLMQVLVVVHILGVAADRLLTGDRLVRAMVTGTKELEPAVAAKERPLVGAWRAAVLAVVVLAGAVWLHGAADLSGAVAAASAEDGNRRGSQARD